MNNLIFYVFLFYSTVTDPLALTLLAAFVPDGVNT